jgi:hypothetical protein
VVAEPAALVENVVGYSGPAEVMTHVDSGVTIWLGPHDIIMLSYLNVIVRAGFRAL